METTGEATIEINAPASDVYRLITDLSRMGDWSPECYRTELHDPKAALAVGTTFQGYNRSGPNWWNVPCRVVSADDDLLFEFEAPTGIDDASTWSFALEARGATTRVTERFNAPMPAMPETPPGQDPERRGHLLAALDTTLRRIKVAAESST